MRRRDEGCHAVGRTYYYASLVKKTDYIEMMVISKAMNELSAFTQIRVVAAKENKLAGHRISVIIGKENK